MLDSETKRRIDSARDILVGKVPDPKSQVEQITIALIYKFMDDMDSDSARLGGKRSFFKGDYKKYAWQEILSPALGGSEMVALYGEAISAMTRNPALPPLFRAIFKNTYLPYRDPETLKLFLRTINEFEYDHSERLGDAFEYLLSVLGSQGDAGQFRTPRNIIDFMVKVIAPQKDESILDPACGTAGFLIAAYNYILHNEKPSAREVQKIMDNVSGYEISPDMERLSLVNLYLHGFPNPNIIEYDTLTSDSRWNEYFDVILANPPFMTPKGGIRPHAKFGVASNRSEVLFVDYIACHLKPEGRAGVIVPEGIIFQSAGAYKQLRKMLVEQYLYAVVSLPAGVFNPYSGVKTSILFLDKQLAKKSDTILFIKIENDGFSLDAKRRPIAENDLPAAVEALREFRKSILNAKDAKNAKDINFADFAPFAVDSLVVSKTKIAEGGEYNLTGERYRVTERRGKQKYPTVKLGDCIATITPPQKIQTSEFLEKGNYPIIDQSQLFIAGYTNAETALIKIEKDVVVFGDHTCAIKYIDFDFVQGADGIKIISTNDNVLPKFLYYILKVNPIESDGYKRHFSKLKEKIIPLPPLEVQQEIVSEIEGYQKIIDGARQVIGNWKPQFDVDPDWQTVRLGEIVNIKTGKKNAIAANPDGEYPFFTCAKEIYKIDTFSFDCEALLLAGNNASADYDVKYYNGKFDAYQRTYIITISDTDKILYKFLQPILEGKLPELKSKSIGNLTKYLTLGVIENLEIPLPPLEVQREIVSAIEAERTAVDACRELVRRYGERIKRVIEKVWG